MKLQIYTSGHNFINEGLKLSNSRPVYKLFFILYLKLSKVSKTSSKNNLFIIELLWIVKILYY